MNIDPDDDDVMATDPNDETSDYTEAIDALAPDGYDQGFGSDDCS